jgi:hypothetical protein
MFRIAVRCHARRFVAAGPFPATDSRPPIYLASISTRKPVLMTLPGPPAWTDTRTFFECA